MAWTITRLCRECLDTSCVSVCPVDCIYEYVGEDRGAIPNQLYINPDECIECGACEPECPWQAIYGELAVPEIFKEDIDLNHKIPEIPDQFAVKKRIPDIKPPTPAEVEANKRKWDLDPNA